MPLLREYLSMVSTSGQWLLHRDLLADVYRVTHSDLAMAYKQYMVVCSAASSSFIPC